MPTRVSAVVVVKTNDPAYAMRQWYGSAEPVDISGGNDWTPKSTIPVSWDALHWGGVAAVAVSFVDMSGNTNTINLQPGETLKVAGTKVLNSGTGTISTTLHAFYF